MTELGFNVTLEEIQRYDWPSVVGVFDERELDHSEASMRFFKKTAEMREIGDEVGERIFRFLGAVMGLSPRFHSKESPYCPQFVEATRRSSALEDFTPAEGDILRQLAAATTDPELKARFADVGAVMKFDPASVREAVAGYLSLVQKRADWDHWPRFIDELERALQLASKLGRKQLLFGEVIQCIESLITKFSPEDAGLCCSRLLQLLLDFSQGDDAIYATLSETLAQRAETNRNSLFARTYWSVAAEWHRQAKQEDAAQRCAILAAETHVAEAEAVLKSGQPSYMTSAHYLALAVEALRRSNAPKERIQAVHRLLLERQKRTKDEMGFFSHELDIVELQKRARKLVESCDLQESIIRLATSVSPLNLGEHRNSIEKTAKDFPFSFLFGASKLARDGRVVAQRPSLLTTDPEQCEAALWAEMIHQATNMNWPFRVQSFIDPCRIQIWRDHHPRIRDLQFLVGNHPFVPPGHEHGFARGFHAGFEGDWHAAAYFLVPQVENSIRYVLDRHGVITSKLDKRLIQEVRSLDVLLCMEETTEILGQEHVFELRGILTEEFGSNLRNRLAHGLLLDGECYSLAAVHLWWLLLRLCVIPILPEEMTDYPISSNT